MSSASVVSRDAREERAPQLSTPLDGGLVEELVHFYFIWTKRGHVPRWAHGSFELAAAEAKRLATLNPGKKFIILRAVSKLHVPLSDGPAEGQDGQLRDANK